MVVGCVMVMVMFSANIHYENGCVSSPIPEGTKREETEGAAKCTKDSIRSLNGPLWSFEERKKQDDDDDDDGVVVVRSSCCCSSAGSSKLHI